MQRAAFARQAVEWLTQELNYWEQQMPLPPPNKPGQKESTEDKQKREGKALDAKKAMRIWLRFEGLAGVRDAEWTCKMPPKDREACERLWDQVRSTYQHAV